MVNVTELNRGPDISANAIDAASVSVSESLTDASGDTHTGELADKDGDDLTPNTLDFDTSITDAQDNTVTDLTTLGSDVIVTDPPNNQPTVGSRGDLWYRLSNIVTGYNGELWTSSVANPINSGVAIADGTAVIADENGFVYGFSLTDGSEQWSLQLDTGTQSGIAIEDGVAVVGDDLGGVYGISVSDGSQLWKYENTAVDAESRSGIAIEDGVAVVGTDNGNVWAISVSNGNRQWTAPIEGDVVGRIAIQDNSVFVGAKSPNQNSFKSLDFSNGDQNWEYPDYESFYSGAVVSNGVVVAPSESGLVFGFSADDGTELWENDVGESVTGGIGLYDGTVVFGGHNGNIYGISISDGSLIWTFSATARVQSGAAVLGGTAILADDNNNVYGISVSDGTEQWSYSTSDRVESAMGVASSDATVILGDQGGTVYALEQQTADKYLTPRVSNGDSWVEKL